MYMNSFCANGFEVDAECNEVHSKTLLCGVCMEMWVVWDGGLYECVRRGAVSWGVVWVCQEEGCELGGCIIQPPNSQPPFWHTHTVWVCQEGGCELRSRTALGTKVAFLRSVFCRQCSGAGDLMAATQMKRRWSGSLTCMLIVRRQQTVSWGVVQWFWNSGSPLQAVPVLKAGWVDLLLKRWWCSVWRRITHLVYWPNVHWTHHGMHHTNVTVLEWVNSMRQELECSR